MIRLPVIAVGLNGPGDPLHSYLPKEMQLEDETCTDCTSRLKLGANGMNRSRKGRMKPGKLLEITRIPKKS